MTTEQLRDMLSAQPFRPFRAHLADGREVDIQHPEFAAFGGGRTFVVYTSDDHFEIIDLLLVTSLEIINGSPRRGRRSKR
ncbi:MAG: hypothetical protein KY475_04295 [Planctomycetes bacterium]|nr:hypothetical protein [Planctomycetota bacterium]